MAKDEVTIVSPQIPTQTRLELERRIHSGGHAAPQLRHDPRRQVKATPRFRPGDSGHVPFQLAIQREIPIAASKGIWETRVT
jgi:hypothetical protein